MDGDLASLHEKIDLLTATVDAQRQRLELLENSANGQILVKLEYLVARAEEQRRFQDEMEELKRDIIPIANHMIKLTIDELAEVGSEFQAEDLLFMLKRLLRDTRLIVDGLDRLESMAELFDETQLLSKQIFNQAVVSLDRLEQDGYFSFARGGWRIAERIVSEFSEEDINALGDNIVTILKTVRNLTQPEIMAMTNNALGALQTDPPGEQNPSMWTLLRDLSDPKVRRGMARLLNMVKVLADQPAGPSPSQN
jgi:uncharacterized protein YjgD (DUF1641 family)